MKTRDRLITQPGVLSQAHPKSPKFGADEKRHSTQEGKVRPGIDHHQHMSPPSFAKDLPYNPNLNFSFSRDPNNKYTKIDSNSYVASHFVSDNILAQTSNQAKPTTPLQTDSRFQQLKVPTIDKLRSKAARRESDIDRDVTQEGASTV